MHDCLRAVEIQELIFRSLKTHPSTLLALARTCRTFTEVAIDCLWEEASLGAIISALPKELFAKLEEDTEEESESKLPVRFSRGLTPTDWEKYYYYATRIINLDLKPSLRVYSNALLSLCLYRPAQLLLPRLKTLDFDCTKDNMDVVPCLPSIFHSGLKHFSLMLDDLDGLHPLLPSSMAQLPNLCPSLEQLTFDCFENSQTLLFSNEARHLEDCIRVIQDMAPRLVNLRSFVLRPSLSTMSILCNFVRFSALQNLTLHFEDLDGDQFELDASPYHFQCLSRLSLQPITWTNAFVVLDMVSHSPLKTLDLRMDGSLPTTDHLLFFSEFFDKLSRFKILADLHMEDSPYTLGREELRIGNTPAPYVTPPQLNHIQRFCFDSSAARLLCSASFLNIISSWTFLSVLTLSHRIGSPQLRLQQLVPIIRNCHHLRILETSVVCRPFDVVELSQSRHSNLITTVSFRNSPLIDSMGTLRCLLIMFPRATAIKGEDDYGSKRWSNLNNTLQRCLHHQVENV